MDRYHFLFEQIDRGVVFHSADGKLIDANPAAERILGFDKANLQGRHAEDGSWKTIHEDGSEFPGSQHPVSQVLATGEVIRNVVMGVFNPVWNDYLWIRIDAFPWTGNREDPPAEVCVTFEDITDLIRSRKEISANESRLKSLVRIQQYQCETVQEFLDYALEEAIRLTESKIGYIYHYHEETEEFILNTWSRGVMAECSINEPQTLYHLEKTGIWGEAVRQRKPILVNDFKAPHPMKRGYPEGHAPLTRFLTVPVFHENRIVAVVGVANKEAEYTETDILQLTLLMENVWKDTERKKAEEALRKSLEYQGHLLDLAPDAFFHGDTEGKIVGVNKSALEMTGMDRSALLGISLKELFTEQSLNETPLDYKALNRGEIVKNERYMKRPDGSVFPIEMSSRKMPDGSYQSFIRDITQRKRVEEELQTSEARFRRLFDQSPLGALIVGLDLKFQRVNEAFCRMLGYSEGELLRLSFQDITSSEYGNRDRELIGQLISGKRNDFSVEKQYVRKDGSLMWAHVSVRLIRDEHNRPLFFLPIVENIDRRKEEEAELLAAKEKAEESDRLKTAFLNNISHEIRTPLNGLIGFSGCLLDPDLKREEQASYLEIIDTCGKQLLSIIDDIVSIALIDAGQARYKPAEINLTQLIDNLNRQFNPIARQKNLALESLCHLEKGDLFFTDETKLIQILSNLLHNALKFCRVGSVSLGCEMMDNTCLFWVADTGIGIAPEKQSLIFERFRQADESISQEYGGTGLGLSIAKAYVTLLGGELLLESEPGKGTRFWFELPRKPESFPDE